MELTYSGLDQSIMMNQSIGMDQSLIGTNLEESIVSLARDKSMEAFRKNSYAKFEETAIPVNEEFNNGSGKFLNGKTYTNKCLFIAIKQGLKKHKITEIKHDNKIYPTTAETLMKLTGYISDNDIEKGDKKLDELFDSNNPTHKKYFQKIFEIIPDIQIIFHSGIRIKGKQGIYVNPDVNEPPHGKGNKKIHICARFNHFAFLDMEDTAFISHPKTPIEKKIRHQQKILDFIEANNKKRENIKKKDEEYAKILVKRLEEENQKKLKEDEEIARKLQEEEEIRVNNDTIKSDEEYARKLQEELNREY